MHNCAASCKIILAEEITLTGSYIIRPKLPLKDMNARTILEHLLKARAVEAGT